MERITAQSVDDLVSTLRSIDISVPERTNGRDTEHCERWSICRFLATYADTEIPDFPVEIDHQDRPDFVLRSASGSVGIEVTEAVAENAAAIDAYREHHKVDGPFPIKRHHPDDKRLKRSALVNAATSRKFGPAWAGNASELEWAQALLVFVKRKVEKSRKPGFELKPINWLLIYDNWSVPALKREEAAEILFNTLSDSEFGPFQAIYIETGALIWKLEPSGYTSRQINDLWFDS